MHRGGGWVNDEPTYPFPLRRTLLVEKAGFRTRKNEVYQNTFTRLLGNSLVY